MLPIVVIPLLFYMAYWIYDGAIWCADSMSYVVMYDSREPLYPTLLALFRHLIPIDESLPMEEQRYLFWVVGVQSILAAVSVSVLVIYLVRQLKLSKWMGYILMMIPLGVSLLNRYAAKRGSMYSNCILTEGITISIFLLFIRFVYEYMITGSRRSLVMSVGLTILGVATRKQMYVLLALLVIVVAYVGLLSGSRDETSGDSAGVADGRASGRSGGVISGRIGKTAVTCILCVALALGIPALYDCTYNYILRGDFTRHTEDNRFVSTMAIYTAEREYAEYIDPGLKDIWLEIYDECDAAGFLYHSAPDGWLNAVRHFEENYDHIQLDVMQVVLERTADHTGMETVDRNELHSARMDAIRSEFNSSLLPHEVGKLMHIFINNLLAGLVLTVAKLHPVLCIYAVIAYALYLGLLVVHIRRGNRQIACFAGLTLAGILVNVALVSAVIFCQTRYTIYLMTPFYIALALMIYGIWHRTKTDIGDRNTTETGAAEK